MSLFKLYVTWNTSLLHDYIVDRKPERFNFSLLNNANLVHNLFLVYYQSLHVSSNYGPIIRRNNGVFATLGTCYSVWMTVWYVCGIRM
jgi:hypothetical protein